MVSGLSWCFWVILGINLEMLERFQSEKLMNAPKRNPPLKRQSGVSRRSTPDRISNPADLSIWYSAGDEISIPASYSPKPKNPLLTQKPKMAGRCLKRHPPCCWTRANPIPYFTSPRSAPRRITHSHHLAWWYALKIPFWIEGEKSWRFVLAIGLTNMCFGWLLFMHAWD